MKKIKHLLIISLVLVSFIGNSYAEDSVLLESTGVVATGSLSETLVSTGSIDNNLEETSYIYYYGQGCPHCANLDKYISGVDGYEKLNIVKKEVYFDDKNRQDMLDDGKRLGLEESAIGLPFFIINKAGVESPMVGDGPIIDYLKPILGEVPENKNKTIILAILSILAIIIPIFLIKLSNKN
ncbi:MAG: hypothetical protein PHV23_03075 [Candidatus Gracilibacteria bacterium]|nr:hypothetical protein [Candidatus Gracilibacteria bacterium]